MKVLFVGNVDKSIKKYKYANDYMRDLLYYGLVENLGEDLYSSSAIRTVHTKYKNDIPDDLIWGKGFTTNWLLDTEPNVPEDIENKIIDRYFDAVIYGDIRTSEDYIDIVTKAYPSDKIIIIDGRDDTMISRYSEKYLTFKRELTLRKNNVKPISFAIPGCKIAKIDIDKSVDKVQFLANSVPYNPRTFAFKREEDYYNDYRKSFFGITMKKDGWDCMRHYEIMANGCIPIFFNIENCPHFTLTSYPKELCKEAFNLFRYFDFFQYLPLSADFMKHCQTHNTTRILGEYVLSHF